MNELGLPSQCRIEVGSRDEPDVMSLKALCGDDLAAWMDLNKRDDIDGVPGEFWTVNNVVVKDRYQRQGLATALYEAAARAACADGLPLASPSRLRDAKSTPFWEKQVRKGRAVRIARPHRYLAFGLKRGREQMDVFIMDSPCDHASDLSEMPGMIRNVAWWAAGGALVALVALAGGRSSSSKLVATVRSWRRPPSGVLEALRAGASRYSVPLPLMIGVAHTESRYDPKATSRAGAKGLMQLMPKTAASLGVADPYNPQQSALGGAKFLQKLRKQYGGWEKALAAYNWGQGNVNRNPRPAQWPKATRNYVANVMKISREA